MNELNGVCDFLEIVMCRCEMHDIFTNRQYGAHDQAAQSKYHGPDEATYTLPETDSNFAPIQ